MMNVNSPSMTTHNQPPSPNNTMDNVSSSQQLVVAHNNNSTTNHQHVVNGSAAAAVVGGMGTNTGNTQVLQELFRQQQHLQTQQSMNYHHHQQQQQHGVSQLNSNSTMQHSNSNFQNNSGVMDPNNNVSQPNSADYNLILNMAIRGSTNENGGGGGVVAGTNSEQDFMMQQMMLQQQSQHMMPHYSVQQHQQHSSTAAAMGLSPIQQHHHAAAHHLSQQQPPMMHHSMPHHHHHSMASQVGLSNYGSGSIQDNILTFLGNQQENDGNLVDQSNHHDNLMMNANNQLQISQVQNTTNGWRHGGDKVNFSYFDGVTPYVEHSQSTSVVDTSQLHTNSTNLDDVVMADTNGYLKRPVSQSIVQQHVEQNANSNGLQMFHDNTYNQLNANLISYSTQPMIQSHLANQVMGTPTMKKQTKLLVNESPKLNNDEGREVTNCHCCGRSDAEVSFKKNYSIHEGNIESYRNTFPQNLDQITSGPVCATCYNKQWRFQRGLYDPQKQRKANPREGLKQRLKDGDSTGSPLTPTLAFPLNNRVSAIQSGDYSSPTTSPRTTPTPTFNSKNKRKLTVSTGNTNPSTASGDFAQSDNSNDNYDPDSKRSKISSNETLCYRNKNPDEISIIVQFYQVDDELSSNNSTLVDQINEFNQNQLRIQKQQMFGMYSNEKDSGNTKYIHQFYTTALKVNKKHFDVSPLQPAYLQLIQGKLAFENIKQLLTDRAKQVKIHDPKTSTSTSASGELCLPIDSTDTSGVNSCIRESTVLCVKISSQDRFKNVVLADVDGFFFVDKNLSEGDSIHVFLQ